MAIPSSYTEAELKTYMVSCLGDVATVLGVTVDDLDEAVNDVLIAYGITDIANAADIAKLRALAKAQAWTVASTNAAALHDIKDADVTYSLSQLRMNIAGNLYSAKLDASLWTGGWSISVSPFPQQHPYRNEELE